MAARLRPPHDCRITARCLKDTFQIKLPPERDFSNLRSENTLIDTFFHRREHDASGGEDGERVRQIRSRPAFKLTSGRMRGATWFEVGRPPQGIVWLLGAEMHDERHKGDSDAYDILGALDKRDELMPQPVDYTRLELTRRRWDTERFADDLREGATALVEAAVGGGGASALAGVPTRAVMIKEPSLWMLYVAVSSAPVRGLRSGLEFSLDQKRFLLLTEGVRQACEAAWGPPALCDELRNPADFPGGLARERAFVVLIEP